MSSDPHLSWDALEEIRRTDPGGAGNDHIASCRSCRDRLQALEAFADTMRRDGALPPVPPAEPIPGKVGAAMDRAAARSTRNAAVLSFRGNSRRAQAAFTLVELLVVVAILSILAAMLLPALKRAVVSAREVSCMSNMRTIYLAEQMYDDDYRHLAFDWHNVTDWNGRWTIHLWNRSPMYSYLGISGGDSGEGRMQSVLFCPSTPDNQRRWSSCGSTTYAVNHRQFFTGEPDGTQPNDENKVVKERIRISRVKSPGNWIFHFESESTWGLGPTWGSPNAAFASSYTSWTRSWHGGKRASLFWDGRVTGLEEEEIGVVSDPYHAGMPGTNWSHAYNILSFP